MAQGLFLKVGPDAGPQPTRVRQDPKIPSVPSAPPKGGAPEARKQTTNNFYYVDFQTNTFGTGLNPPILPAIC